MIESPYKIILSHNFSEIVVEGYVALSHHIKQESVIISTNKFIIHVVPLNFHMTSGTNIIVA